MAKYNNLYKRGEIWWIRYNADGQEVRKSLRAKSVQLFGFNASYNPQSPSQVKRSTSESMSR